MQRGIKEYARSYRATFVDAFTTLANFDINTEFAKLKDSLTLAMCFVADIEAEKLTPTQKAGILFCSSILGRLGSLYNRPSPIQSVIQTILRWKYHIRLQALDVLTA
jgi:hypothetical protein